MRKKFHEFKKKKSHGAVNPSFHSFALLSAAGRVKVEVGVFAQVWLFWVSSARWRNHFTVGTSFSVWLPGNQKPWVGPQKACAHGHTDTHTRVYEDTLLRVVLVNIQLYRQINKSYHCVHSGVCPRRSHARLQTVCESAFVCVRVCVRAREQQGDF